MNLIAYKVTKHTIPGWVPIHHKEPRGIAYETDTHFVHIFGRDSGLWTISIGLTATEAKSGTLVDSVQRTFGAQDIVEVQHAPGHATKAVWRPGLYFDDEVLAALDATSYELRLAEQALLLLIQRLDELLHYVEPTPASLSAYSHKARELLILACTEAENYLGGLLRISGANPPPRGFTTNDYVKLLGPLWLSEFVVSLPRYTAVHPTAPFSGWSSGAPTQSLSWYDAYNKTKHDRANHFGAASLENGIRAVMAVTRRAIVTPVVG